MVPMSREEILAMEPGRELDEIVAAELMDKELCAECRFHYYMRPLNCIDAIPDYSTDIAAAWEVVNKLLEDAGIDVTIYNTLFREWAVDIANDGNIIATTVCKSVPEGICKAALLTLSE